MENELYPLKFKPILKETIWGGDKLHRILNKKQSAAPVGESWELSGVDGNLSVVINGFLAGNTIEELVEVYMGDLLGDKVYDRFGMSFPLLIKFIDAHEKLSIQVHPGDDIAEQRHESQGKTEMWYVIEAAPDAELFVGFKEDTQKQEFLTHLNANTLESILAKHNVKPGDTFFIPAGTVHGIGAGILLAEIQQSSDITYRIFDYNRKDKEGRTRQLHTDLALDVINYKKDDKCVATKLPVLNKTVNLVSCEYFSTNILRFNQPVEKDYYGLDSFVIYICTQGFCSIRYNNHSEKFGMGDTFLLPAVLDEISLIPSSETTLLEVYLD